MAASSTWFSATHARHLDGVPGSWFQPGLGLAVVSIWRNEPAMGVTSFSDFQINIKTDIACICLCAVNHKLNMPSQQICGQV